MNLRSDTIGHFDNPSHNNIRSAVVYSGEGGSEGDIVKLITDDQHYLSIWVGQRNVGHTLTLKSGHWKVSCADKLTSSCVVDLMISYLINDLSVLGKLKWERPLDMKLIDNIKKLNDYNS